MHYIKALSKLLPNYQASRAIMEVMDLFWHYYGVFK